MTSAGEATGGAGATRVVDQATLATIVAEVGARTRTPGAVALLRAPAGTSTVAWGTRTFGGGEALTVDDHVRIGSNTKTMTGTVILQLAQEGRLSLDDTIGQHVGGVPNGDRITIEQLLAMRSGLPNYSATVELNRSLDEQPAKVWSPSELLDLAFAQPPAFEPGAGYMYSNTNTVLLGLLAEERDGKPLHEVVRDRIVAPLGLSATLLPEPSSNAIPSPHPRGYMYGTNVETLEPLSAARIAAALEGTFTPGDVTDENPSWAWAAGAVISTLEDLAVYAQALVCGGLLDEVWQQRRLASIRPTVEGNPAAPGYGWALAKLGPFLGHTGELPGFNTFMAHDPVTATTLVVWSNLNAAPDEHATPPAVEIARAVITRIHGSAEGASAPSSASG